MVLAATTALVGLAGPASADVPEYWSNPEPIYGPHLFLILVGIPVALALVIVLLVLLPSLARGDRRLTSGPTPVQNQWLGGPRKTTAELAGPDSDDSEAGGASGRW